MRGWQGYYVITMTYVYSYRAELHTAVLWNSLELSITTIHNLSILGIKKQFIKFDNILNNDLYTHW